MPSTGHRDLSVRALLHCIRCARLCASGVGHLLFHLLSYAQADLQHCYRELGNDNNTAVVATPTSASVNICFPPAARASLQTGHTQWHQLWHGGVHLLVTAAQTRVHTLLHDLGARDEHAQLAVARVWPVS